MSPKQRTSSQWRFVTLSKQTSIPSSQWRRFCLGVGAICGGSVWAMFLGSKSPARAAEHESARFRFNFIADVVEKVRPAVVHITCNRQPWGVSNGSGFIIREDGLILSNAHVVANSSTVNVKLKDGREFQGTVQCIDSISDLATIKIQAKNLPTLPLGKSDDLRPGEFVVAMGSPLTLSDTVTSGIVSTTNRGLNFIGQRNEIKYIQTDAPITHGHSGGPLVNLDGEAIGINTMKLTDGISFAIPSDYAQGFLNKVFKAEKRMTRSADLQTHRFYTGLETMSLTSSLIQQLRMFGLPIPGDVKTGVFVKGVHVDSPAYNAGLKPGDIFTHINGQEIKSAGDFNAALQANKKLKITLLREHRTYVAELKPQAVL